MLIDEPLFVAVRCRYDFDAPRLGLENVLHFLGLSLGINQRPSLQAHPLLTVTLVSDVKGRLLSSCRNRLTLARRKGYSVANILFSGFAGLSLAVANGHFQGQVAS